MTNGTAIEWTHRPGTKGETWNPIRARHRETGKVGWHCETVSDGCRNCYAAAQNLNSRNLAFGTGLPYKPGHREDLDIFVDDRTLEAPLRWRAPRTIFVCSMTDAFAPFVTDDMLDRIFAVAVLCPQHVFIFVTKRAARMRSYVADEDAAIVVATEARSGRYKVDIRHGVARWEGGRGRPVRAQWPLPNVWLLVSCEDQETANERVPELLATPAAVRGVSAEPLLGPIDFERIKIDSTDAKGRKVKILDPFDAFRGMTWAEMRAGPYAGQRLYSGMPGAKLDWIIAGGESGPDARPMHPDWARSIRDQCEAARVPFFFKQWGAWAWAPEWMAFGEAEAWARSIGAKRIEHHSSGHTAMFVGKRAAGRTLDGREHDDFPDMERAA